MSLDLSPHSVPDPDLAVVPGEPRDYIARGIPTTALLVVEVSDTMLSFDRNHKASLYAAAGIADYWIVNLVDRQLEVHRGPGPDPARPGRFGYRDVTLVPATGATAPLAAPHAQIAVVDLLP